MHNIVTFCLLVSCAIGFGQSSNLEFTDSFNIEIIEDEALSLINPDSPIKIIGEGFKWTEGPLWIADGNYLLFSDIPNNSIFKIDASGILSTYLKPSGYLGEGDYGKEPGSNGLLLDKDGKLVLMQHGERSVARMISGLDDPKPEYEEVIGTFEGKRFNSPNDAVYDAFGNLYFTDPPYGLPEQMADPGKELSFQGVYCLKTTGELVLVDTLSRPNGITFSPDGTELIVSVSDPEHAVWYKYDIVGVGIVENKRLFFDTTHLVGKEGQLGLPDGMKMHRSGNLFATGPGGLWILNEQGKAIARIHTGQATSNCAFSSDYKRLFLTADDFVLEVSLN